MSHSDSRDLQGRTAVQVQLALAQHIAKLKGFFVEKDGELVLTDQKRTEMEQSIKKYNTEHDTLEDTRLSVDIVVAWYKEQIRAYDSGELAKLNIDEGIYLKRPDAAKTATPPNPLSYMRSGSLVPSLNENHEIVFLGLLDLKSKSEENVDLRATVVSKGSRLIFSSGAEKVCKYAYDVSDLDNITKYASLGFKPDGKKELSATTREEIELNNDFAEVSEHANKMHVVIDKDGKPHRYTKFCELGDLGDVLHNGYLDAKYTGSLKLDHSYVEYNGLQIEACKLDVLLQLAQILADLEKAGIDHNDLKPENIFCHYDVASNRIILKLGDFGMANRFSEDVPLMHKGGTYEYTAPEVWRARIKMFMDKKDSNGHSPDPRTIIFTMIKILGERYTKINPDDTPPRLPALQKNIARLLQHYAEQAGITVDKTTFDSMADKIFKGFPETKVDAFTPEEKEILIDCNVSVNDLSAFMKDLYMHARDACYGLETVLQELGISPEMAMRIYKQGLESGKGLAVDEKSSKTEEDKVYLAAAQKLISYVDPNINHDMPSTAEAQDHRGKQDQYAIGITIAHMMLGELPDLTSVQHQLVLDSEPIASLLNNNLNARMSGKQLLQQMQKVVAATPSGAALLAKMEGRTSGTTIRYTE